MNHKNALGKCNPGAEETTLQWSGCYNKTLGASLASLGLISFTKILDLPLIEKHRQSKFLSGHKN